MIVLTSFTVGADFAGELDLARAQRAASAGQIAARSGKNRSAATWHPAQAAGHDRVALEVAGEKPQIRV
jgi:hypothetical protein